MALKARKRKSNVSDETNANDVKQNGRKVRASSKEKSSNVVFIVLIVMVVCTWAIAATAYFGVVDYKALVERLKYIDKRRLAASNTPVLKSSHSLESPSTNAKRDVNDVEEKGATDNVQKEEAKPTKVKKDKSQTKKKEESKIKDEMSLYNSVNDQPILKELAKGEALLKKNKGREALNFFKKLLATNSKSPRAMYGKAMALFILSEQERSNALVEEGIATLNKVGEQPHCPKDLKKKAFFSIVDKYFFLGRYKESLTAALAFYKESPNDVEVLNKLGVCYLFLGKNAGGKKVFERALAIDPNDGFALVHLGFIVKAEGDMVKGASYLRRGIFSEEEGTQQGKFYMHLGDALHRINRTAEAEEIYQRGADKGLFLSKYQRSLYNVDRLKSRPFWTAKQTKAQEYVDSLEKNWKVIRDEALKVMDVDTGLFLPEEENLKNTGDWKQLTLYARGREQKDCKRMPKTCGIIKKMPNAIGCKRGQIKFSIMQPGTHVWAHTGPTNCRLRMHLGLVIPKTGEGAKIRCADQYKTWEEGKVLIFDDSFEHEVWQNALSYRLILIMDIWHPDLTESERRTLSPI